MVSVDPRNVMAVRQLIPVDIFFGGVGNFVALTQMLLSVCLAALALAAAGAHAQQGSELVCVATSLAIC